MKLSQRKLITIMVLAIILSLLFSSVAMAAGVPKYIYYRNAANELVRADYQQAEDDLFPPVLNPALMNAIREKLRANFLAGRAIYVEDEDGRTIDYRKAARDGLTYAEAYPIFEYWVAPQTAVKELIIDPVSGLPVEVSLIRVDSVSAVNDLAGNTFTVTAELTAEPAVVPVAGDFDVVVEIDGVVAPAYDTFSWSAPDLEATFTWAAIQPIATEQEVDFSVAYNDTPAVSDTITIPPLGVEVDSVEAVNGTVTVILSEVPATAPVIADFTITQSIDGGAATTVTPTSITWTAATKTAVLTVPEVPAAAADQSVVMTAAYKNTAPKTAAAFIVPGDLAIVSAEAINTKVVEVTFNKAITAAGTYTLVTNGVTLANNVPGTIQANNLKVRFSVSAGNNLEDGRTYNLTANGVNAEIDPLTKSFVANISQVGVESVNVLNKRQIDVVFNYEIERFTAAGGALVTPQQRNFNLALTSAGFPAGQFQPQTAVLLEDNKTVRLTLGVDLTAANYFLRLNETAATVGSVGLQTTDGRVVPTNTEVMFTGKTTVDLTKPQIAYAEYNEITGVLMVMVNKPYNVIDRTKFTYGGVSLDALDALDPVAGNGFETTFTLTLTADKAVAVSGNTLAIEAGAISDNNVPANTAAAQSITAVINNRNPGAGSMVVSRAVFVDSGPLNPGTVGVGDTLIITFSNKLGTLPAGNLTDNFALAAGLSFGTNPAFEKLNDRQVRVTFGAGATCTVGTSTIRGAAGVNSIVDASGNRLTQGTAAVIVQAAETDRPFIIEANWVDLNQDSIVQAGEFLDLKFNKTVTMPLGATTVTNANFQLSAAGTLGAATVNAERKAGTTDTIRVTLGAAPAFVAGNTTITVTAGGEPNIIDSYGNVSGPTVTPVTINRVVDTTAPTFTAQAIVGAADIYLTFSKPVMNNAVTAMYSLPVGTTVNMSAADYLNDNSGITIVINGTTVVNPAVGNGFTITRAAMPDSAASNSTVKVELDGTTAALLTGAGGNTFSATDTVTIAFTGTADTHRIFDIAGNRVVSAAQPVTVRSEAPVAGNLFASAADQAFFIDPGAPTGTYKIYLNGAAIASATGTHTTGGASHTSIPVALSAGDVVEYTYTDTVNGALESTKTADGSIPHLRKDGTPATATLNVAANWNWNAAGNGTASMFSYNDADAANVTANLVFQNGTQNFITAQGAGGYNYTGGGFASNGTMTALSNNVFFAAGNLEVAVYNGNGNVSPSVVLGSVLAAPTAQDLSRLAVRAGTTPATNAEVKATAALSQGVVTLMYSGNGDFNTVAPVAVGTTLANGVLQTTADALIIGTANANQIQAGRTPVYAYRDLDGNIGVKSAVDGVIASLDKTATLIQADAAAAIQVGDGVALNFTVDGNGGAAVNVELNGVPTTQFQTGVDYVAAGVQAFDISISTTVAAWTQAKTITASNNQIRIVATAASTAIAIPTAGGEAHIALRGTTAAPQLTDAIVDATGGNSVISPTQTVVPDATITF